MKLTDVELVYQEIIKAQQSTIDSLMEVITTQSETLGKYIRTDTLTTKDGNE